MTPVSLREILSLKTTCYCKISISCEAILTQNTTTESCTIIKGWRLITTESCKNFKAAGKLSFFVLNGYFCPLNTTQFTWCRGGLNPVYLDFSSQKHMLTRTFFSFFFLISYLMNDNYKDYLNKINNSRITDFPLFSKCSGNFKSSPEHHALGVTLLEQGAWTRWPPEVTSNLNQSVILRIASLRLKTMASWGTWGFINWMRRHVILSAMYWWRCFFVAWNLSSIFLM